MNANGVVMTERQKQMTEDFGPIYSVNIPGFKNPVDVVRRDNGRVAPEGYEPCHTVSGWRVHVPSSEFLGQKEVRQ